MLYSENRPYLVGGCDLTHFEGWQSRALLIMGRVTRVRLVLSTIPVFLLSHTVVPRSTLARLEQMFRNFL